MKIRKRLAAMNEEAVPGTLRKVYCSYVNNKVRERYTADDVEAIMRKKLVGLPGADEEFAEYNAYAEKCKAEARLELGI